jgi:hypothetical protein
MADVDEYEIYLARIVPPATPIETHRLREFSPVFGNILHPNGATADNRCTKLIRPTVYPSVETGALAILHRYFSVSGSLPLIDEPQEP